MAADLGPGDLVECLEHGGAALTVGAVYCVAEVFPPAGCDCITLGLRPWAFAHASLLLADGQNPAPPQRWCSYMFRPISRRSDFARTLEALKLPRDDVPAPTEREPATA